jgi:hypothetical protein
MFIYANATRGLASVVVCDDLPSTDFIGLVASCVVGAIVGWR